MMAPDINTTLVESYFQALRNLSPVNKLNLIGRLTDSLKSDFVEEQSDRKTRILKAFGSFESSEDAEDIAREIRESRTFTRKIEEF